jgi:hypothetical protein
MASTAPFQPRGATGTTPTVQTVLTISAAVQQLTIPPVSPDGGTMRIVVDGSASVAWSYGTSASLTIDNGCHMLGNTVETFSIPPGITQLSVIGSAAVGKFRVTVGDGI